MIVSQLTSPTGLMFEVDLGSGKEVEKERKILESIGRIEAIDLKTLNRDFKLDKKVVNIDSVLFVSID